MPITTLTTHASTCPTAPAPAPTRRPRGAARLEFALTVIVVGVLIALALTRLAPLQALADDAVQRTQAAQRSAKDALAATRCPAASSVSNPVSCPSTTSQGVSP